MESLKKCSRHKGYLPKSEFAKDTSRKDGYSYVCRSCRSKVTKKYNDNWRNKTPVGKKHGMTGTVEHEAWMGANQRCANPKNEKYSRYGGRGIVMCKEWRKDFLAFYLHIGPKPSPELSLDRIDNDGNYEPGNVRWATKSIQSENKRRNYGTFHDRVVAFRNIHTSPIE